MNRNNLLKSFKFTLNGKENSHKAVIPLHLILNYSTRKVA